MRDRDVRRLVVGLVAALAMVVGTAGVAAAHVEVTAEPAQAGAQDAVVTFSLAAESETAGITGVRVQLPEGIAPADVTLAEGPQGWQLTPTADGYQVSGPAAAPGQDVTYAIRVAQLPAGPTVLFKTLQDYSDGTEHAWIQEPGPDGSEPERPAPALSLAPAPPDAVPPSTAASTTEPPASASDSPTTGETAAQEPASDDSEAADDGDDGGSGALLWLGLAVVLAAAALGAWLWRRRQSGGQAGSA